MSGYYISGKVPENSDQGTSNNLNQHKHGEYIMKASKERKMERKRKHKALAVAKTVKSRQRRLDNKAKRDEILAINPDAKITIVDGITYMNGAKVKVINGQIKSHLNTEPLLNEPIDVFEPEPEKYTKDWTIDDQIEKERLGVLNPFRWKKKLNL